MTNITNDRARDALAFCRTLEGVLCDLPEKGEDESYHDFIGRLKSASRAAEARLQDLEPGCRIRTRFDGTGVHAFGFSASSTTGFAAACRNYIKQVREKCAETGMEV